MTADQLTAYRNRLKEIISRIRKDVIAVEDQCRVPTGGQADGGLSNAPLHLGDIGTDVFHQEINSALLENEESLLDEALSAVRRIDEGTFGDCEGCARPIALERLTAIPYARHCKECAEKSSDTRRVSIDTGRPEDESKTIAASEKQIVRSELSAEELQLQDYTRGNKPSVDRYAAGTPGGGTSVGGLAGTTTGRGDPDGVDLESALGAGVNDSELEDTSEVPQGGPKGGAVGGTPAGKRTGPSLPGKH